MVDDWGASKRPTGDRLSVGCAVVVIGTGDDEREGQTFGARISLKRASIVASSTGSTEVVKSEEESEL